eukprot:TRINITY_DN1591_c0_g1_i12.p2 TRINITY_DN1591_c0_g1~~TRINITY_DN1591_c0_g1_i12.p2  ORF type:complete len:127 (+),score=42.24 TRINITY_DN1591_c0_g1_i12:182-562(+)
MCIRDRGYPPCTPGGGPRPWYTCKVDLDCIACDSPEFYSAFCDNSTNDGACHFNNWWQGVRLIHGPTDDMDMFHMADDGSCHVLNVYSGNTRYQCWEDLSLIHISEPTRLLSISYAVFCLKKKKKN